MEAIKKSIRQTNAYECLECGKCTGVCPVSEFNGGYSPRRLVTKAVLSDGESLMKNGQLWDCITCGACSTRCISDVKYVDFMQQTRAIAFENGKQSFCAHGGILHSMMRYMAKPEINQHRLDWLTDDLKTSEDSEYLYFVGCLPYFNAYFSYLNVDPLETARSTIKILNKIGIEPQVLADERCCGHDLLWTGDKENFKKLGNLNLDMIRKSGAKKVVTACAECTRTFSLDYTREFGGLGFEVVHLSELISNALEKGQLKFKPTEKKVTYQDACRLGRHLEKYDEPRSIMDSIPGLDFREMSKNKKNSVCCGTSAWANCSQTSKQIQSSRLTSAVDTGAETLVTSCPKCAIHFSCAMSGEGTAKDRIELQDLTVLAASALE